MNKTSTLCGTGTLNFGPFVVTYVLDGALSWVSLYDANRDDETTKEFETEEDTLNCVTMLFMSQTTREEFFNA